MIHSSKLFALFREYRGRRFLFVEPGGNHGDRLIYRGAETLGRASGLDFRVLTHGEFMRCPMPDDGVVYIHGGGGCVPLYSGNAIKALRRALREHAGITILGPQTIWTEARYLARIFEGIGRPRSGRVVLFTRELTSYSALAAHAPAWAEVEHDHDTALNLSAGDLRRSCPDRRGHLLVVRRDGEAVPGLGAPEHAADPVFECRTLQEWVDLHDRAARIATNRLHSAIVAAVLGVPATLLPNSYFKNRAVWEYSLNARGVAWSDRIPDSFAGIDRAGEPGMERRAGAEGTLLNASLPRRRSGPESLADTIVFLAIDRAYVPWATLFLRSLGRHHKDVRATVQGVNLEAADLIALAGCPGTIAVSNARVDLKGRRLAEYVANRRPIWFREVVRQEEARWYLLADADLLVRRPLGGLKALAAGHDAALVFRPGYWKGRVWAKLRVAAGLVLVGRSAGPLLDEWVACLHSDRPIEDVRPWAWFWEQACLYLATTRVPLRYAPIPMKEYLSAYPFTDGSAIWSANVRPGLKPVVYERFARELREARGGLRSVAALLRRRRGGRTGSGPPGIPS